MNVLIVSPVELISENSCGTSKIIFNLVSQNNSAKFDIISPGSICNIAQTNFHRWEEGPAKIGKLRSLFSSKTYNSFRDSSLESLRDKLESMHESYNIIHFFSYQFTDLIKNLSENIQKKTIVSLIDSHPLLFDRKAGEEKTPIKKMFLLKESQKYRDQEEILINSSILCHFVSSLDSEYFNKLHPNSNKFSVTIENGVDDSTFHPIKNHSHINDTILFFGNLFYAPNIQAVEFISEIQKHSPQSEFRIIGKENLFLSERLNNLKFNGFVEDLNKEINKAEIAIFPIFVGSGIKNKVLEALASGIPLLCSKVALEGIPLPEGKSNLRIVNSKDPKIWADEINKLRNQITRRTSYVPFTWSRFQQEFYSLYSKR